MSSVYKGRVVDLNIEDVVLPNGHKIKLELIRHPGASAVVPLKENRQVVIIRQYRYAAGGMIYEIPAGRLDPGEAPLSCAKRELSEEVGLKAAKWDQLGSILTTPGFTDEKIHIFLASELEQTPKNQELDEIIEVVEKPFDELISMIEEGKIIDGKTICGLMLAYFRIYKGVS